MSFQSIFYDEVQTQRSGIYYVREDGMVKHKSVPMVFQALWYQPNQSEIDAINSGRIISYNNEVKSLDAGINKDLITRLMKKRGY